MSELLNGILLRRTRYSDTSLIISWFTDRRGKLRTIAKGVLRQNSAFSGKLDLFFHCDLLLSFSRKTDLHTLREVSVRTTFEHIRKDYLKTSVASYFVELIDGVTESDHPVPEIYQLLLRALGYLDAKIPGPGECSSSNPNSANVSACTLLTCIPLLIDSWRRSADFPERSQLRLPDSQSDVRNCRIQEIQEAYGSSELRSQETMGA